jgi:hypothetical protein
MSDLVKFSSGRNPVDRKWVFKKRMNTTVQVKKFKARLEVKGYSQVKGVNFSEIFSPVEKLTSMEIENMDVKTVFLHGDLEEEIYIKQLEGFRVRGKKNLVCKLKRSFYRLKKSPKIWYQNFDTYILILGFVRSKYDR